MAARPMDEAAMNTAIDTRLEEKERVMKTTTAAKHRAAYQRTEGDETWLTPRYIVDALGPFDLDPATPESGMPWRTATKMLRPSDDGLKTPWPKSAIVWMNPPYGPVCGDWMRKCADHGNGFSLIFARTETVWFQEAIWFHPNLTAVFFFAGRIRFIDRRGEQGGTSPAPSMLIAYGMEARERLERAVLAGKLHGRLIVMGKDQEKFWQAGRRKVS